MHFNSAEIQLKKLIVCFLITAQICDWFNLFCINKPIIEVLKTETFKSAWLTDFSCSPSIHDILAKVKSLLVLHELCSHKMETFYSVNSKTDSDTECEQSHWFIRWDGEVVWSIPKSLFQLKHDVMKSYKWTGSITVSMAWHNGKGQSNIQILRRLWQWPFSETDVYKHSLKAVTVFYRGNSGVMSRVHSQFVFFSLVHLRWGQVSQWVHPKLCWLWSTPTFTPWLWLARGSIGGQHLLGLKSGTLHHLVFELKTFFKDETSSRTLKKFRRFSFLVSFTPITAVWVVFFKLILLLLSAAGQSMFPHLPVLMMTSDL